MPALAGPAALLPDTRTGPALLMTWAALWPTLHLPGFSLAQRALDAGVRALVLFTGRQGKR
ncbi:hypothetical protein DDE23_02965 [Pararhodobacter aggregans]|uniref:Uncharacterized protein n=1 Tax=Pararhodobacter aggregans TaxID=404875 RepID=A0A2T7UXV0_9RHOB|nr:hypothetical protein DDE23_02965 [Pararhodobacter aggregans]